MRPPPWPDPRLDPAAGVQMLLSVPGAQWVRDSRGVGGVRGASGGLVPDPTLALAMVVAVGLAVLLASGVGDVPLAGRVAVTLLALAAAVWAMLTLRLRVGRRVGARRRVQQAMLQVRTRRWDDALVGLAQLLAGPRAAADPAARVQALLLLSGVLARFGRHDDAVALADELLEEVAGPVTGPLHLNRAMALLRADRLSDADDAIRQLRRAVAEFDQPDVAAGLAIVECYRDVLTNHLDEAADLADKHARAAGESLGERAADLHALRATALHRRGDTDADARAAADAWRDATLLADAAELVRRYPEAAAVSEAHAAVVWPDEAGGGRG